MKRREANKFAFPFSENRERERGQRKVFLSWGPALFSSDFGMKLSLSDRMRLGHWAAGHAAAPLGESNLPKNAVDCPPSSGKVKALLREHCTVG